MLFDNSWTSNEFCPNLSQMPNFFEWGRKVPDLVGPISSQRRFSLWKRGVGWGYIAELHKGWRCTWDSPHRVSFSKLFLKHVPLLDLPIPFEHPAAPLRNWTENCETPIISLNERISPHSWLYNFLDRLKTLQVVVQVVELNRAIKAREYCSENFASFTKTSADA